MTTYKTLLESIQVEVPDYVEVELPEFFENIISLHSIVSKIVGNHEYFLNQMLLITWKRLDTDFIEISMYSFFPKEP